jgi:hypothetical protein
MLKCWAKKYWLPMVRALRQWPTRRARTHVKKVDNSGYKQGAINSREQYIGGLFKGTLSFITTPTPLQLKGLYQTGLRQYAFYQYQSQNRPRRTRQPHTKAHGRKIAH